MYQKFVTRYKEHLLSFRNANLSLVLHIISLAVAGSPEGPINNTANILFVSSNGPNRNTLEKPKQGAK